MRDNGDGFRFCDIFTISSNLLRNSNEPVLIDGVFGNASAGVSFLKIADATEQGVVCVNKPWV